MTTLKLKDVPAKDREITCSEPVGEVSSRYMCARIDNRCFYVTRVSSYGERPQVIDAVKVVEIVDA